MLCVVNFTPAYCPACGAALRIDGDPALAFRFASYHAERCPKCGLMYQLAQTEDILRAATACGGTLINLKISDGEESEK